MSARFWLFKSEPGTYSIEDLARERRTAWDGVRNYQARNFLRDDVRPGDGVLFYHSRCAPPAVVGLARVSAGPSPDPSALDPESPYHDPRSTPDEPRWVQVEVEHLETFPEPIPIATLRADPHLEGMLVARRGQRLSVQPVEMAHFARVLALAKSRHEVGQFRR